MNPLHDLSEELRQTATVDAELGGDVIDIRSDLQQLLQSVQWTSDDRVRLDHIARKLDITKKVFSSYSRKWISTTTEELDETWRAVCAAVLCTAFVLEFERDSNNPLVLKRLNVAYKAIDYLATISPDDADRFRQAMERINFSYEGGNAAPSATEYSGPAVSAKTTLPLTVLFYEGPIARAYLETIASLGFRPRKIVHLVSKTNLATGRERLRWLPTVLRKPLAASMQRNQIFHWPNVIAKRFPDEMKAIIRAVATNFDFEETTIRNAQVNKPLIEYSSDVESVLIENLRDPVLLDYLSNEIEQEFLFTGGGIVPPKLLEIPGARYIHVHPGFLPDIRGADGLLWSILTNGCPSASAFYMAPGIDTGAVILRQWLPEIRIPLRSQVDVLTRYRMAFALVDPWVRCRVLREVLTSNTAFSGIDALSQDETDGITYHFMHEHLREMAVTELFGQT
jgi:hypothetical protein